MPKTIFTKGGGGWLDLISTAGADAVGVDWQVDLGLARNLTKGKVALQGNLDPVKLLSGGEGMKKTILEINTLLLEINRASIQA